MRSWRTAVPRLLTILPTSILAVACSGGSGEGLGSPTPPPSGATFSAIQQGVFTPTCATIGCHQGVGAPQGLRLDASSSHALLVGVPSSEVPGLLRVDPGNPADSYLIRKLEGTAAVGARMPLGGAPLPQATIDDIRQWIFDGALDDRVPSTDPIRVTALSPVPGSDQPPPAAIVATFDRELDVSTLNANTFVVEGSGGDGTFGDGNEIAVGAAAITTPAMTPMSVTFEIAVPGLADDTYRVLLRGSGPSLILDLGANALDGEFGGSFPSGDGVEGGDFEATFTVTAPPAAPAFEDG